MFTANVSGSLQAICLKSICENNLDFNIIGHQVDLTRLYRHFNVTDEFIIQHMDCLNLTEYELFEMLALRPNLPKEFLEKHRHRFKLKDLIRFHFISEKFLESNCASQSDWNHACYRYNDKFSREFVANHVLQLGDKYLTYYTGDIDLELLQHMLRTNSDLSSLVCMRSNITEQFILENLNYIDMYQDIPHVKIVFSDEFVQRFRDELNWVRLSYRNLSRGFVIKFEKYISFGDVQLDGLPLEMIERHMDEIKLYNFKEITTEFVTRFVPVDDWEKLTVSYKLSHDFIEKYYSILNLKYLCIHQKLGLDFIKKHEDILPFNQLLKHQVLDEEFLERNLHRIDWRLFNFGNHNVSEAFYERHNSLIQWSSVIHFTNTRRFSTSFLEKHGDKLGWWEIYRSHKLSDEFIMRHHSKIDDVLSLLQPAHRYIPNGHLSERLINYFLPLFKQEHWKMLSMHYRNMLSIDFIRKHKRELNLKYYFSDRYYLSP